MIDFDFKGIRINVVVEREEQNYKDAFHRQRTWFERKNVVSVNFWTFSISEYLRDLAFIKSILNFYMHSYWKRSKKNETRIELCKSISQNRHGQGQEQLWFIARQKNKINYLQICHQIDEETHNQLFLDGQEVLMLEVVLGKTISLLQPRTVEDDYAIF